jgi:hypothetical protein
VERLLKGEMTSSTPSSNALSEEISNMPNNVTIYQSDDGKASLEVRLEQETVWLNQKQMAELFDKDTDTIGLHIRNIYSEGELEREATAEESSVVQMKVVEVLDGNLKFTILT